MASQKSDPRELSFWKERLLDRTILSALKIYPEQAKRIFGPVPVMRGDIFQLGMILAARQTLAEPPGHSSFDINTLIDEEMRSSIDALPDELRSLFLDLLNPKMQDRLARNAARRIIEEATGEKLTE
jgi:hypothetical protein